MHTFAPLCRWRVRNAWAETTNRLAWLALAAIVTAGCETSRFSRLSTAPPEPATGASSGELTELVRYGNTVRRLGPPELERQYAELVEENGGADSDAAIRLALLLSAPNATFGDIDQATRYLRGVMYGEAGDDQAHADFAQLLYNLFSERIYADSEDPPLQALLDQARERNDELTGQLLRARNELDEERERAAALQGQLNALKELEEQLSQEEVIR